MEPAVERPSAAPGRRSFRPPRGLGVLLVIVAVVGLTWALVVPPWQSPDEIAHFAYAQSLAEGFRLPNQAGHPVSSRDFAVADRVEGASRTAFYPRFAPPQWSSAAGTAATRALRPPPSVRDGGGRSTASGNPPLYYLYAAAASRADHGGSAFGRLYTIRLAVVILLLLTTLGGWLLAGEVFARRRLAQLLCAATTGLLPMATFISTSVNPDALLMTTWTMALWLGARIINRGPTRAATIALAGVTAAAILTKATSYALVPPALLALGLGWRRRPPRDGDLAAGLLVAMVVFAVPVLAWLALAPSLGGTSISSVSASGHAFNVRQFLSYVWQFYLPRLPFETPFHFIAGLPLDQIWVRELTGVFGWRDIFLAQWIYTAAVIVLGALAIASVGLLVHRRPRRWSLFAFLGLALLALLHITEYRALIGGSGPFLQGRYLLPVLSLLGLAVALVGTRLPPRIRAPAAAVVLGGLLAFQCLALGLVAEAYYL